MRSRRRATPFPTCRAAGWSTACRATGARASTHSAAWPAHQPPSPDAGRAAEIKASRHVAVLLHGQRAGRARELLGWGVDAFCTDRIDLIGPDFAAAPDPARQVDAGAAFRRTSGAPPASRGDGPGSDTACASRCAGSGSRDSPACSRRQCRPACSRDRCTTASRRARGSSPPGRRGPCPSGGRSTSGSAVLTAAASVRARKDQRRRARRRPALPRSGLRLARGRFGGSSLDTGVTCRGTRR